jgi:D-beta-D-heptose 7-phosphate kinase/D-beta-D-heptose 1-phosphate adenosyltransferase
VIALSGRAHLAGVVGADASAEALREALNSAGVAALDLVVDAARPTTSKTRIIAHAQQVVRADHEESGPLPEAVEAELARRATARVAEVDAVVVSDYRKGVITEGVARAVIQAAVASGKPVVVDPKGLDYARYRGATVLTPNVHDAALTANLHVDSDEDLVRVAERLSAVCDGAALLITRGAAGMSLFQDGGRFDVGTRARDVYDVTGAGDTVVAMLAVALGRGVALPEAVRLANAAAGVVVGKVGTSTVSLEEVQASLDEQPLR